MSRKYEVKLIGVYGIVNTVNGKWYIGQSYNLLERERYHFCRLRTGRHDNQHLQDAFKWYGEDAFKFVILELIPKEFCDAQERFWIQFYNTNNRDFGYNKDSGGRAYKEVSDETRKKLSIANSGPRTPMQLEASRRLGLSRRGKKIPWLGKSPSSETREKQSMAKRGKPSLRKGKKMPPEFGAKISLALTGRKLSEEHVHKIRLGNLGVKKSRKARLAKLGEPYQCQLFS